MSFVVKEVELSNIRSHDHIVFTPAAEGVTALLGKNGTGKSSIIDSVAWALFGTKIGGLKNSAIMKTGVEYAKNRFFVKVIIDVDGQQLLVERKFVSKAGTVEANVYAIEEDSNPEITGSDEEDTENNTSREERDGVDAEDELGSEDSENESDTHGRLVHLAGPAVSHAERYIRQRLGMDERGFLSSVLVQQKQVDQLISASARERAGVIEDLTGITALTKALDESRKEYNALKKASTVSSADAEGIEEGEQKSKELRKEGNVIKQDILDRNDELELLREQGQELRSHFDKALKARKGWEKLDSELQIVESKYANAVVARDEAVEERNELKKDLEGMTSSESAEAVMKERDSASDEVNAVSAAVSSLETKVETAEKGLRSEEAKLRKFLDNVVGVDAVQEYADFLQENMSEELQNVGTSIDSADSEIRACIENMDTELKNVQKNTEGQKQAHIQAVSSHQSSIDSLSNAVEVLSKEDGTCPTCLQTVSDANEAVAGLNKQIQQHEETIKATQSDLGTFKTTLKTVESILSEVSVAEAALTQKTKYETELRQAKDELEVSSGEYRVAKDKLNSLKKKADKASSVLYRTEEYQRALKRAQKFSRETSELEIRAQGIREDLREKEEVSESKIQKLEKDLEKKLEEYQNKSRDLVERKGDFSIVKERLFSEERHLKKLRDDYEKHQKLMKTISIASSTVKIIEEFRTDQIENSVPVIENYASDFIARFTDSKFVKMELDTKFNASVMLDDGTKRPVAALSGGELSSAAISLRLAVSMLLGGGSQSNSLLLDEILTAVDDERSDSILAAIKETIQGQVILISHSSHVNDFADSVFEL